MGRVLPKIQNMQCYLSIPEGQNKGQQPILPGQEQGHYLEAQLRIISAQKFRKLVLNFNYTLGFLRDL